MGRALNTLERKYVLSLHRKCRGTARKAERYSRENDPEMSFSYMTVLKYWREAGLATRGRGGPHNKGKTLTRLLH